MEGNLVEAPPAAGTSRSHDKIRIDLSTCQGLFELDQSKVARGWWVCSCRGDYYRLLEPNQDRPHAPASAAGVVAVPFLERRLMLAILSNLFDLVLRDERATRKAAQSPVQESLREYADLMRKRCGIHDIFPYWPPSRSVCTGI
jgi:hypothetical protein